MTGCEECFFGGKTIGGKGNFDSPIVIVGEAPHALEIVKGIPFVSDPGKLLHSVLELGCNKLDYEPYFTNALSCLPRKKNPKKLANACRACNSRLIEEIKAHPRDIIIAMGNGAVWSLTGNYESKITQIRGNIYPSELAKYGIMATVHPSFLLRGGGNIEQFKIDVYKAISLSTGSDFSKTKSICKFKEPKYEVLTTPKQVAEFANALRKEPFLADATGDVETSGFNARTDYMLCLGVSTSKDFCTIVPGHLITNALFDNDLEWCWHNGKFDVGFLRAEGPREPNELDQGKYHPGTLDAPGCTSAKVHHDTMLLSYMLNEVNGIHDLEQVGTDWLGAPNYKDMLKPYLPSTKTSYANIPVDILHKYLAIDVCLTHHLKEEIYPKVEEDANLKKAYHKVLITASEFLHQMQTHGFKVDYDLIAKNEARLEKECDERARIFNDYLNDELGMDDINLNSWQQLHHLLYKVLELGPMGWNTRADTIKKLMKTYPDHPVLINLLAYRTPHKQLTTFVRPIRDKSDADGRLRSNFKLHATTTGRLASNAPNIQNIPRDHLIRGQFIAGPGRKILDCDLSQAELRVLACLSQCTALCDIFINDVMSLHDEVAIELFGDNFDHEDKMKAKMLNFGIIYGITGASLAKRFGLPREEGERWVKGWFERFPGAHKFIERCRAAAVRGENIITRFGRKRRFNLVSRDKINQLQNEAANFPEQSHSSDITVVAGTELIVPLREDLDCLIVNSVHDCLVSDLPDDEAIIQEAAKRITGTLMRVPTEWGLTEVPFKAEARIGDRWGEDNSEPLIIL